MKHHHLNKIIIALIIFSLLIITTITIENTLTGLATKTTEINTKIPINITTFKNTQIQIEINKTTGISISGTYTGTGDVKIYANTETGQKLLIKEIKEKTKKSKDKKIRLTGYAISETENKTINNSNTTIENNTNIKITINETNTTINNTTNNYEINQNNTTINTTTNETNTTINNTSNNIINQSLNISQNTITTEIKEQITEINNECQETCKIPESKINSIEIEITQGELKLHEINYKQKETTAKKTPKEITKLEQIKQIPNLETTQKEKITINLTEYFEGQNIFFDITSSQGYNYKINKNNILEITPKKEGIWSSNIYASNGEQTITSNEFIINITKNKIKEQKIRSKEISK